VHSSSHEYPSMLSATTHWATDTDNHTMQQFYRIMKYETSV